MKFSYATEITSFFNTIPEHTDWCVPSWQKSTKCAHGRNWDLAFTAIHKQPYPLLHYFGMCQEGTDASLCLWLCAKI